MFKDLFSQQSSDYAKYRPEYPEELFQFIVSHVETRENCWDCATGNGQASVMLAKYFSHVAATDASPQQLRKAVHLPNITYALASETDSLLRAHSTDLVTVAQAIHWLNFERFYFETRRVLKKEGLIAVWGYGVTRIAPRIDAVVEKLYSGILAGYWSPERKLIEDGYKTIPFPFKEIETPPFEMKAAWNLFEFAGYLHTWSSVQQYKLQNNTNPVELIMDELSGTWGKPEEKRIVRWGVFLRLGRL